MAALGALPAGLDEAGLLAAVRAALDVPSGAAAGLAVSGGADSVALAHLAARTRPDVRWVVVHVRHGLRDDAADARAAARCAAAVGAAYDERVADVRLRSRTGVEAAARDARYAALRAAAVAHALVAVCVAHTADDRAETVLLNLGRGAGPGGLGALRARRSAEDMLVLRPLLAVRRADVRRWARSAGLEWVEDPTNADARFRRTRARAEVLPALARLSGGPGDPVALLCRLADLAADDADALDDLAGAEAAAHVVAWGPVRALRADVLARLHPAVGRRVVRALLAAVRGGTLGLPAADVEAVRTLAPGTARTVAGGIIATSGQGWLAAAPRTVAPLAARPLVRPGGTPVPEVDVQVVARQTPGAPAHAVLPPRAPGSRGPAGARLPARAALTVRGPRTGDRMRTAAGTAPVGRLLAGAGVPRPARAVVPVVVDAADEVLWIPGVATHRDAGAGLWVWLEALPE